MGNFLSRRSTVSVWPAAPSPTTFFPDSVIREREDAAFYESMRIIQQECIDNSDDESDNADQSHEMTATAPRKKRAKKQPILEYTDSHGVRKELPPEMTSWYLCYVNCDLCRTDRRKAKKFRRRFRMPYDKYLELLDKVKADPSFESHMGRSGKNGTKSKPIELLLLGSLRYLGRGWTFDDLEENTGIGEETFRRFFHTFIQFGSTVLYNEFVITPSDSNQHTATHQHEFNKAGCHGAIGSTDAVHVTLEKVQRSVRNSHLGWKLAHTARTYNVTVNHRRRILSTTDGHPARWNDKTLILFDEFLKGIQDGEVLQDTEFFLYEYKQGAIVRHNYLGCWVLCDNGYLAWSTTVPPNKVSRDRREKRWSEWIESMRKDVECTFGILKGRWRILKTGIRLHGTKPADKIFKTCCALHNWLLEIDGLDDEWERGVASEWQGSLGQHHLNDPLTADFFALHRLAGLTSPVGGDANYDLGSTGYGKGADSLPDADANSLPNADSDREEARTIRRVWKLSLPFFRRKLIEHFDILWRQHKIEWPVRNRVETSVEW
jgi:hypothetical protein